MKKRENRSAQPGGAEDLIVGRQSVYEALPHGNLSRVVLLEGQKGEIIDQIVSRARRAAVPLSTLPREEFIQLTRGLAGHQGVAATAAPFRYLSLEALIDIAKAASDQPFLILLDHLQDPQNLGSIIRTADAAGVHGLILPGKRSVKVTPAVRKVAAGAVERARIAQVTNLSQAVEKLKEAGFWIYGAEADGRVPFYTADLRVPLALVVGSEGKGLSPLVRRHCDQTLFIPMQGAAGSLNVSVATAVLTFAATAQRKEWRV